MGKQGYFYNIFSVSAKLFTAIKGVWQGGFFTKPWKFSNFFETPVEKLLKRQEKLIAEVKSFDLLDNLTSNKWKNLNEKDLNQLHKIVMTEVMLNGLKDKLSISEMSDAFKNNRKFSKEEIEQNIASILEDLQSFDEGYFEKGFLTEKYIDSVKTYRLTPIREQEKVVVNGYLKEDNMPQSNKDTIKRNMDEINRATDSYANKLMAVKFIAENKDKFSIDTEVLLRAYTSLNATKLLAKNKDFEDFNKKLVKLLEDKKDIHAAVLEASEGLKGLEPGARTSSNATKVNLPEEQKQI